MAVGEERARAFVPRILPPLVVVALSLPRVLEAAHRASFATLGRDQGIFQYVAWAIGQGDSAYRDVRDVNGPLVPLVHLTMQILGGTDEHRFRLLDLGGCALAFALAGACLVDLDDGPRGSRLLGLLERGAWALAAVAAIGAQYLVYGFWDTAQRESFFDAFVLVGLGAGLAGQRALGEVARGRGSELRAFAWLVVAGAASTTSVLGKPTYALFAAAQALALLVDRVPVRRVWRLVPFVIGAAVGLAVPFLFLVARGDVAAWARITFVDVPSMYRFIWPRPIAHLFEMPGYARTIGFGAAVSIATVALALVRVLPLRALAIGLFPALGFASVVAQAKGFPYHFHPMSAGTSLAFLAILRAVASPATWHKEGRSPVLALVAASVVGLGAAAGIGYQSDATMRAMPWPEAPPPALRTPEALDSEEHLEPFIRVDFFPRDLREAADFLQRNTRADERVQAYGMDAYLLFLARRRSATPIIYAYDLNVDAALAGAAVFGGEPPTPAQRARIQAMRDAHEADMLASMKRRPPAAFVFHDDSPLMSSRDAVKDFELHCPTTMEWVRETYAEAADFGRIHVWMHKGR